VLALALTLALAFQTAKVSQPFHYAGYSKPEWTGSERSATFVTMKDGTKLAVDVVVPTGWHGSGPAPSRFPVIFRYTPYGRSYLDLASGRVIIDPFFLQYGYAMVSADMRGTGGSFGWMNLMDPRVRDDGKELVDWIAAQPWSDGNVGMRGGSYEGWSQLAVASKAPKALKAIVPQHAGWDGFLMHPGGIYSYAFMQIWTALTYHLNRSSLFTPFPIPPTPPVIDEDGDGQIADEIPLDLNHNGWFSDDYRWPLSSGPAPQYADGVARTHHYYLDAVMQHIADPAGAPGTFDGDPVFSAQRFWDTKRPGDGRTAPDLNWAWAEGVMKSGVAILNLAGWFDAFVEGTFQVYGTMRHAQPSRIIARPVYHQGVSPAFAASIGVTAKAAELPMLDRIEELRWFDRWLKRIPNGVDREPPVLLYVMNDGWRPARSWPVPGAAPVRFFLNDGHALSNRSGAAAGTDVYTADFTQYSGWDPPLPAGPIAEVDSLLGRPAPGVAAFRRNRQFMFGVPEGPPVRPALGRGGVSYSTAPLAHDTEVIGHPIVHLFASSTADDGDFYFYLEDVDPAGQAVLVTEFQHRAGFARQRSPNQVIPGNRGITVDPALPWHGFRQADYDARVFAGGKVAEIVTALYPTAWRFKAGHAIRLTITSADWPTFELHPKLSPSNRPDAPDNVVPEITVHHGGARRSFVELPIVR
jgi:putative CocE/NonD family hydrolase